MPWELSLKRTKIPHLGHFIENKIEKQGFLKESKRFKLRLVFFLSAGFGNGRFVEQSEANFEVSGS